MNWSIFGGGVFASIAENYTWAARVFVQEVCDVVDLLVDDYPAGSPGVVLEDLLTSGIVAVAQ